MVVRGRKWPLNPGPAVHVKLNRTAADDRLVHQLADIAALERLELSETNITDAAIEASPLLPAAVHFASRRHGHLGYLRGRSGGHDPIEEFVSDRHADHRFGSCRNSPGWSICAIWIFRGRQSPMTVWCISASMRMLIDLELNDTAVTDLV